MNFGHCEVSLNIFVFLQNNNFFLILVLDSNGRLPSGLFSGTSASFGDYDQCLAIRALDTDQEFILAQGKYCLLELALPVPKLAPGKRLRYTDNNQLELMKSVFANETNIKFSPEFEIQLQKLVYSFYSTKIYNGICIPSVCSAEDMEVLYRSCKCSLNVFLNFKINFNFFSFRKCHSIKCNQLSNKNIKSSD